MTEIPKNEPIEGKGEGEGGADSVFQAMPFQPAIELTEWLVKRQGNNEDAVRLGSTCLKDAELNEVKDTTDIIQKGGAGMIIIPKPIAQVTPKDVAKVLGLKSVTINKITFRLSAPNAKSVFDNPELADGIIYPTEIAFDRQHVDAFRRELDEGSHFWTATLQTYKKGSGMNKRSTMRLDDFDGTKIPDDAYVNACIALLWKGAVSGASQESMNKLVGMASDISRIRHAIFNEVPDLIPRNIRVEIGDQLAEILETLEKAKQRRLK